MSLFDFFKRRKRLNVRDAYRQWAATYDQQPDNLVLKMEDDVFTALLSKINLEHKRVIDIGCGTGRHWNTLWNAHPAQLTGIDVSEEMLTQLKKKFPDANVFCSPDNHLTMIEDNSVDVIVSTLTIGHIQNISDAFAEWRRVLRPGGEMLITDFHPEGFRKGMTRTFKHNHDTIEVENHYHSLEEITAQLNRFNIAVDDVNERAITANERPAFEHAGNMHDYERFLGTSLIFGLTAHKTS